MLAHVILEMIAQIDVKQVTQVGQMVACSCAHFRQPGVQLMHSIYPDHVVDIPQLF